MSNIVGIINYGVTGNIYSIKKALLKAGATVKIINSKDDFNEVTQIVIPGVGSFKDAMNELNKKHLTQTLKEQIKIKPTLGICLGMQILATIGLEYGETTGLNILNAQVQKMSVNAKLPHVGFCTIDNVTSNPLLSGLEDEEFYFMHSYELVCDSHIVATTTYAKHSFVSAIHKEHIYGVQFHPEKSREAGLQLFRNFLKIGV